MSFKLKQFLIENKSTSQYFLKEDIQTDDTSRMQKSLQINKILKQNKLNKVAGRWTDNTLHVGVQPQNFRRDDFNREEAIQNFENAINQISQLSGVKEAKSETFFSSYHQMGGIKVTF